MRLSDTGWYLMVLGQYMAIPTAGTFCGNSFFSLPDLISKGLEIWSSVTDAGQTHRRRDNNIYCDTQLFLLMLTLI